MRTLFFWVVSLLFACALSYAQDIAIKGFDSFGDFRKMKVIEVSDSVGIAIFSDDDRVNEKVFGEGWQDTADEKQAVESARSFYLELIAIDVEGVRYDMICLKERSQLSHERYYILNVFGNSQNALTYFTRLTAICKSYGDLVSKSSVMQLFLDVNYADNPAFERYNYYIVGWYHEGSYFTTLCIL